MNLATIGTGIWGFLKRIPEWVLWVIAALLFLKFVDINAERRGRRKESDKQEVEKAREQARVDQTRREIAQENQDASIRADEAVAALPRINDTHELREHSEAIATELLGPDQRSVR